MQPFLELSSQSRLMSLPGQWPSTPTPLLGKPVLRRRVSLFLDPSKKDDLLALRRPAVPLSPTPEVDSAAPTPEHKYRTETHQALPKPHSTSESPSPVSELLSLANGARPRFSPMARCPARVAGAGRPGTPLPAFIRRGRRRPANSLFEAERISPTKCQLRKVQPGSPVGKMQPVSVESPQNAKSKSGSGECLTCADVAKSSALGNASAWWSALSSTQAEVEQDWQSKLTPFQFKVLRMKATEPANSGALLNWFAPGVYNCAGCSQPLYKDDHKMPTTCGWPAFKDSIVNALHRQPGKKVPEITCSGCGGHLGHVFKSERYPLPHHERHCVNSASLKFVPACADAASEREQANDDT